MLDNLKLFTPQRIVELTFSDLMIGPNEHVYLRYVKGYSEPIIAVPTSLHKDIQQLIIQLRLRETEKEFNLNYDSVPYRVARIDTMNGRGFFLRRPKYPVPPIHELGFIPAITATLKTIGKKTGIILFAGATGSGKSTSIYSLLQEYLTIYGDIVIAVEDPPEIPMQGCYGNKGLWYQIDVSNVGGYEYAMIAAMRYNPRFIFIGEIRSPIVANEAIRAAVNGHLVLATIHGNSISGAILALQQIAAAATGSNELARAILADGLIAVVYQCLVSNPHSLGERELLAQLLYFGDDTGLRSKIRLGKLEYLSTEIEMQRIKINKGINLATD